MGKDKTDKLDPPSYASYSEGEREAFLSQLGNFTPYQRTVFHSLCKENKGLVKYRPFAERMSLQIKNVHSEIEGLIKKLSLHRLALLTYTYDSTGKENQRKKDSIILTDQGEQSFYRFSVQQLLDDLTNSTTPRLPTASVVEEYGITIPEYMVSEISRDQLRKPYIEDIFITPSILRFPVKNDEYIFFISSQLNQTIQLCIQVIQDTTQSSNILSEFARFKNTTMTNLKQNLATRTPSIWIDLTKSIIDFDSRQDRQQFAVNDSFCQAAEMVYTYLKNEIDDAKQKKEHERELETDLQQIVEKLKKNYFEPINQEKLNSELDKLKKKYGGEYQNVKDHFFEKYAKMKDATKLPPVVFIGRSYIHRNHLHKYAAFRLKELAEQLEKEYVALMMTILKTNNRDEDVTFYSRKNFNVDIENRVRDADTFIDELLDRPRVLAEAIIHVAKEEKQIKEIEQVRHILEQYFQPGTMRYKPLSDIFSLNIYSIFKKAFTLLPVLRQFWMKITGRFRTAGEKYGQFRLTLPSSARDPKQGGKLERTTGRSDTPKNGTETADAAGRRGRAGGKRTAPIPHDTVPSRRRKGMQNVRKQEKHFTKKQTDEAWDVFRDSLKK